MKPNTDNETEAVPTMGVAGLLIAVTFAIGVALGAMVAMAIFTK